METTKGGRIARGGVGHRRGIDHARAKRVPSTGRGRASGARLRRRELDLHRLNQGSARLMFKGWNTASMTCFSIHGTRVATEMPGVIRLGLAFYEPGKAGRSAEIVCETKGRPPNRHA